MKAFEISIIIPVYNEEKNLSKCLDSLNNQTSKKFEVIFIDDGSTDRSVVMIHDYMSQHPELNIKLISQKNSGAAAARKAGMAQCVNDYVINLDCDDQISAYSVEAVIDRLNKSQPDIVLFELDCEVLGKDGLYIQRFNMFKEDTFAGYDAFIHSIDGWGAHGYGCFSKKICEQAYNEYASYNSSNINYLNNDEVITRMFFFNAESIAVCEGIYTYKYNENSTTKKLNSNKHNMIKNSIILCKFVAKNDSVSSYLASRSLMSTIWGVVRYYLKNKVKLENNKEWKQSISMGMQYIVEQNLFNQFDLKRKAQFLLVKILSYL